MLIRNSTAFGGSAAAIGTPRHPGFVKTAAALLVRFIRSAMSARQTHTLDPHLAADVGFATYHSPMFLGAQERLAKDYRVGSGDVPWSS